MSAMEMVPGRECGACTICCSVPGIDTREVQKDTGVLCRHCVGGGCTIYQTRPGACRSFFCAWRQHDFLGEEWRPDKSGVLIQPIAWEGREGFSLMLIAEPLVTVRQPWFIDFVASGIRDHTPLLLAVPGPRGHKSAKRLVNTPVMLRAAAATREQLRQELRKCVKELMASRFEQLLILNQGNDVSLP